MTKMQSWFLAVPVYRKSGNKALQSLQVGKDDVQEIYVNDHGVVRVSFSDCDLLIHGLAWGVLKPPELPAVDTTNTTAPALETTAMTAAAAAAKKAPPPLPKKAIK